MKINRAPPLRCVVTYFCNIHALKLKNKTWCRTNRTLPRSVRAVQPSGGPVHQGGGHVPDPNTTAPVGAQHRTHWDSHWSELQCRGGLPQGQHTPGPFYGGPGRLSLGRATCSLWPWLPHYYTARCETTDSLRWESAGPANPRETHSENRLGPSPGQQESPRSCLSRGVAPRRQKEALPGRLRSQLRREPAIPAGVQSTGSRTPPCALRNLPRPALPARSPAKAQPKLATPDLGVPVGVAAWRPGPGPSIGLEGSGLASPRCSRALGPKAWVSALGAVSPDLR